MPSKKVTPNVETFAETHKVERILCITSFYRGQLLKLMLPNFTQILYSMLTTVFLSLFLQRHTLLSLLFSLVTQHDAHPFQGRGYFYPAHEVLSLNVLKKLVKRLSHAER